MATVVKCETIDCENNEGGSCKLEEITISDIYECDQVNEIEKEDNEETLP